MQTTPKNKNSPAIFSHTGLRGIAALYVFLFHLIINRHGDLFLSFGSYAVDLFFILSGFILNWVYLSQSLQMNWSSFLWARIARITPLYYLTMVLSLPIIIYSLTKYGHTYEHFYFPRDLVLNMFLLSGVLGGYKHTIVLSAWSVSVEFFCYLVVFPRLVFLNRFLMAKPYARLASAVLSFASTLGLVACYGLTPMPIWHWQWDPCWLMRGVFGFTTGFFLCSIHRNPIGWKPGVGVVNLVFLVAIVLLFFTAFKLIPAYMVLWTLPCIVFFSATDLGLGARLLKTKPFQWLGERSYSIYLWHLLFLGPYTHFLQSHLTPLGFGLVVMVLVLATSEISYHYYECPLREYIRKIPIYFRLPVLLGGTPKR